MWPLLYILTYFVATLQDKIDNSDPYVWLASAAMFVFVGLDNKINSLRTRVEVLEGKCRTLESKQRMMK